MANLNRSQRRAAAKQKKYDQARSALPPTKAERLAQIMKQGISPEDLEKEYKAGFEAGFQAASKPVIRSHYAALILAAHELYGFGQERCIRLLNRVNDLMVETLTSEEMTQRAFDEIGVLIDWNDPFDRVQKKEKTA